MVVGVGGIGGIRDIGDPDDPRRGTSAPQQRSIPGAPTVSELFADLSVAMPGVGRRPSMEQTADAIEGRRAAISADPAVVEGRVAPSQAPSQSPTNTSYIDRSFGVTRGFGADGGGQVTPPLSASRGGHNILDLEDGTREIVTPSKGRRVVSSQIGISRANPNGGAPRYVSRVDLSGETPTVEESQRALAAEFSKLGIPLDESDAALLSDYVGGGTPSDVVPASGPGTAQTRTIADNDGPAREISPYRTIEVPNRGPSGQLEGTVRIDPSVTQRTVTAGSEALREALHSSEEEVRQSTGNYASELRTENRTPLISTDTFNDGLSSGRIIQISPKGAHIADLLNDDGSTTPIFSTRVRDRGETAAPMYRVGAPTNTNFDAARDQANPAYKSEGSQFDTQVVSTRGRREETGPVPFLNREDVYPKISGMRRNVEAAASRKPAKRGEQPKLDDLPTGVQERIATAMAPRAPGGTREDRIKQDTASSFVQTTRNGKPYVDTSGLANPLRGQEQSIVELDQVLNELASAGYMADPDVANGNQRLAIEVLNGNIPMENIPERARAEVAQEIQVLQAAARPEERAPVQSSPQITRVVDDNEADLVAAEIRGDERNFGADGSVVQGSYGDFGEMGDDGRIGGITTATGVEADPFGSPEFASAQRAVDDMYGFSEQRLGRSAKITGAGQTTRDQIAGQAMAQALQETPDAFAFSGNPVFEANLRRAAERAGGKEVTVLQGRSSVMRTPNQVAVASEATAAPQSTAQGVVNTDSVSQLNAPAPPDVNPEVARLEPFVGNGVRQSQVDLISKGLAAEPGTARRSAADQLVELFRKRFR